MANWYTYILECADGTYYCGVTTDLQRRVREHNGEGQSGARYTRSRRPVVLAASAVFDDRSAACSAEAKVKRAPRARKLALLYALGVKSV